MGPLGNYIALKYKTKIEVEGQGTYEIAVTNVVNTKTLREKPSIVPSLLNVATKQKMQANRCKHMMQ